MNFNKFDAFPNNEEFERPSNKTLVGLNKGASIEVAPNTADKKIYTFGVDGCTVTVVYSEYEDGTRKGTVTHFEPQFIHENIEAIPSEERPPTKVEATLFVNYDENETFEPKEHVRAKLEGVKLLNERLQKIFGDSVKITLVPYEVSKNVNEGRQIDLIMRSQKEKGNSKAELRWWERSVTL